MSCLAEEHPEFVPAVSIHPARPDAIKELEKCLQAGAQVMNPAQLSEHRLQRPALCPILGANGESGDASWPIPVGSTLPVVSSEFADPRILTLPLECGVTVIAAMGRGAVAYPDYTEVLIELMPGLFTDNSALCTPIRSGTIGKLLQPGVVERVIHGCDYPIPTPGWGHGRGAVSGGGTTARGAERSMSSSATTSSNGLSTSPRAPSLGWMD